MASSTKSADPYGRFRVVLTLDIIGGLEWTSPPMEPAQADILLLEIGRLVDIRVLKAHRVPAGPEE